MIDPKKLNGEKDTKPIINIRVSPIQVEKADFLLVQFPNLITNDYVNNVRDTLTDFLQRHTIELPVIFLSDDMNVIAIETNGLDELKSVLELKQSEPISNVETCNKCSKNANYLVYDEELELWFCIPCFKKFSVGQELFEPSDDFREKYEKGEAINWNWKQTARIPDVCGECGSVREDDTHIEIEPNSSETYKMVKKEEHEHEWKLGLGNWYICKCGAEMEAGYGS